MRYESSATNGVVAWCLELHDLWIAKAIAANREQDRRFCRALLAAGQVDVVVLEERLTEVEQLTDERRAAVAAALRGSASQLRRQGDHILRSPPLCN